MRMRLMSILAGVAMVLGLGVAITPAQAVSLLAVPAASFEPTPPAPNPAWEQAAKAKKVQPWQYEPKGNPAVKNRKPVLSGPVDKRFRARAGSADPIPPSGASVYRNYNVIQQAVGSPIDGTVADMTIADPYLNYASDWHSLMEGAVQDDSGNIVEIGWTVSPTQCPSEPAGSSPCLFGFTWVGGVPQGYSVGFVDSPTGDYSLGDQLPNPNDSSGINFRIVKDTSGNWWLGAGVVTSPGYWVGYFPASQWAGAFTQPTLLQWFTEVATTEAISPTWNAPTPCSDAGNGYTPTSPNGGTQAARILNIKTTTGAGSSSANATPSYFNSPATLPGTASAIYPTTTPATNAFRVGGPGWKGNNTLPGARDGCG